MWIGFLNLCTHIKRQDGSYGQKDYQIWVIRSRRGYHLLRWTIRHKWLAAADLGNHPDSILWTRNNMLILLFILPAYHWPTCLTSHNLGKEFRLIVFFCNYIKTYYECDPLPSNLNIKKLYGELIMSINSVPPF